MSIVSKNGPFDYVDISLQGSRTGDVLWLVAGAVNIVTKPFTDKLAAELSAGADTLNGRHLDGFASDAIGPQHFVVYASSDQSFGYRAFRTQDYQPSATDRDRGYDVVTLGAKYAFDFNEHVRLDLTYQHIKSRRTRRPTTASGRRITIRTTPILPIRLLMP